MHTRKWLLDLWRRLSHLLFWTSPPAPLLLASAASSAAMNVVLHASPWQKEERRSIHRLFVRLMNNALAAMIHSFDDRFLYPAMCIFVCADCLSSGYISTISPTPIQFCNQVNASPFLLLLCLVCVVGTGHATLMSFEAHYAPPDDRRGFRRYWSASTVLFRD